MASEPMAGSHTGSHEETTRERILRAFLRLATERGFEATTTRAVAEAAGVNEVTIFRHFNDKMTLAREAIHQVAPVDRLAAYTPTIDVSSPAAAKAGLVACLRLLRETMWANRGLVQFGMSDAWRYPELLREVERAPVAGRALLERALEAARPALRADVQPKQSAIGLLALVFISVLWQSLDWLTLDDAEQDALFAANVQVLLRETRETTVELARSDERPA